MEAVVVDVIPVGAAGLPSAGQPQPGTALLLTPEAVRLQLPAMGDTTGLVLRLPGPTDDSCYLGVEVLGQAAETNGEVVLEARIGGIADALLQPKNLTPRFHFDTMSFTFGFAPSVLHRWEELGVLQSVVIDRLLLCPRCHGLPTYRNACPQCGSGRVGQWPLPSEFAVVAAARGSCPTNRNGIHVDEPAYHCHACRWIGDILTPVHQCLHCEHRFGARDGYEMVLRGYRVQRYQFTQEASHL